MYLNCKPWENYTIRVWSLTFCVTTNYGLVLHGAKNITLIRRKEKQIQSVPQHQKSANFSHNVISLDQLLQHLKHAAEVCLRK